MLFPVDPPEAFGLPVYFLLFLPRCALFVFEHALHSFRLGVFGASAVALFGFEGLAQAGGLEVEFPLGARVGRWRAVGAGGWGRSRVGGEG